MERFFATQEGKKIDVVDHTLEQINKWPNLKMYIGTDAQDYGSITRFATVIVYRYNTRGAHFVYFSEEVKRMNMFSRLWSEGQRTIEAASMIMEEIPVSFEGVEFDYNHIPKWASHKLIKDIGGWASGLNMKTVFKNNGQGDCMIATKAGDHVCRHANIYNVIKR